MRSGGETPMQTKRVIPDQAQVWYQCSCPYQGLPRLESQTVRFDRVVDDPVKTSENLRKAALALAAVIKPTPGSCRGVRELGDETEFYARCRVSHVSPAQAPAAKLPERTKAEPAQALPIEFTAQWECVDPSNPRRKGPCK